MPRFRKLSSGEIAALEQPTPGARVQVAREYDAYVADFVVGDHGRAELATGERRALVRGRLQAAARRRGFVLRFRPGPSVALVFRVEAAAPVDRLVLQTAGTDHRHNGIASRDPRPSRPPGRRQTATERYHTMLPRWMREGQHPGRRDGRKRRAQ
jgi:hypothetical protein